ncbi:hypothetical protein EUX98_g8883 [Antrodiella citrinella]|uniref:Fungal-type protein kinase domain-containing protein n=1 Tax=Antrodiella citrinella TaxID=2447956 RepID=A0A4S4M1D8_9APHY|nr:hypothetical protein EUX98_g8883 [Antrodiella citrinella]
MAFVSNTYALQPEEIDAISRFCQGDSMQIVEFAGRLSVFGKKMIQQGNDPVPDDGRKLNLEATCPPSWKNYQSDESTRTGTVPFMSYEIFARRRYSLGDGDGYLHGRRFDVPNGVPIHTVIHDIESFFGVLVYQCLVREGPGGHRRQDLIPGPSMMLKEIMDLRKCIVGLFEDRDADMKCRLFGAPQLFESRVISFFHPYFNRLKPLVREWWRILKCTYRIYNDVAQALVHGQVLVMLEKHLDLITAGEGDMTPTEAETSEEAERLRDTELQRRADDLRRLYSSPWDTEECLFSSGL